MAEHDPLPSWTRAGRHGAPGSGVTIAEATIAAAWNVQGDPAHTAFAAAAERTFGIALPAAPNATSRSNALVALWLGPKSWLLVAGGVSPLVEFAAQRDAVNAAGGALFDVSASRIAWTVSGPRAVDVLAKGCPLDFHPRAFAPGTCAQSLYGHVEALIARHDEAPAFTLLVARSYARDAWHSLAGSALQYGVEIATPATFR